MADYLQALKLISQARSGVSPALTVTGSSTTSLIGDLALTGSITAGSVGTLLGLGQPGNVYAGGSLGSLKGLRVGTRTVVDSGGNVFAGTLSVGTLLNFTSQGTVGTNLTLSGTLTATNFAILPTSVGAYSNALYPSLGVGNQLYSVVGSTTAQAFGAAYTSYYAGSSITASTRWGLYGASLDAMTCLAAGTICNIGINNISPNYGLDVNGSARISNSLSCSLLDGTGNNSNMSYLAPTGLSHIWYLGAASAGNGFLFNGNGVYPGPDATYNLGAGGARWKNLYLSGTVTASTAVFSNTPSGIRPRFLSPSYSGPWTSQTGIGTVALSGGMQTWSFSCSAYSNSSTTVYVYFWLNNVNVVSSRFYVNTTGVHVTFPTVNYTSSLASGNVTFGVTTSATSDSNDSCYLQCTEFI